MEKYFKILKVDPGASFDKVKKAYRERVKVCHPDQFPDNFPRLQEEAAGQLRDLNFAFQKLKKIFAERAASTSRAKPVRPSPAVEDPIPSTPRRRRTDAPSGSGFSAKENSAYEADRRKPSDRPRARQPLPAPTSPVVSIVGGETSIRFANGDRYTGAVQANQPHGYGAYHFAGGDRYVGEFANGQPHGRGTFHFNNGDRYEGDFVRQVMSGQGAYFSANGDHYVGGFHNGQPHGAGIHISKSGTQYHGQWENGEMKKYRTVNPAN